MPTLTLEQRYARLERMFKHAASIVDEHRQLQARLQNGNTGLVEELRLRTEAQRAAESLNARVEEARALQRAAEEEAERLQGRIAELDEYGAELRQKLEEGENERKQLESALQDAQAEAGRIPELEEQHAETRTALDEQLQENDSLLERLLDVEQALETATQNAEESAQAWETERAAFEERLERLRDELCAAEDESVAIKENMAKETETAAQLHAELESANAALSEDRKNLQAEIDRLTAALELETQARAAMDQQLATTVSVADRVPGLEEQLKSAQAEITAATARNEEAARNAAEADRAKDAAEKRAVESRAAWDEQRQQLLDEIDAFRAAQRAAEEETAAVRTKSREAAAQLEAQVDQLDMDRANESRLRAAAEEAAQRAQRRAADAEMALDDAVSRREALSRQLESVRADLDTERETSTQLTSAIAESKASIEAHKTRLAEAQRERDDAVDRLARVTGEVQAAQRVNAQLRTRIVDLEEALATAPAPEPINAETASLQAEVEALLQKVAELDDALETSKREKTRLEERLVSTENRAAYSELEGVGYRSKFSSMAKQFFEQEVARLSGSQDEDEYPGNGDTPDQADEPRAAAILDAVSELRR